MLKKIIVVVIALWMTTSIAEAHPHLFIETSLKIVFDEKGMAGIEETWVFDEMFSASIIDDQDKNKNGKFDEKEIATLKVEAFNNLKGFDYFTYIRINNKPFKAKYVKHFKPSIQKNKLVYSFFVPCHLAIDRYEKKIEISIFDTSYFTAVSMVDDDVVLKGQQDSWILKSKIYRNEEFIYMEQDGFPETITLKMRVKE